MSEADKRLSQLLDRWSDSLDLHARYLKLDDAAYAKIQSWPKHQRPNKWIIDLARQRVAELRYHLQERKEVGDDEFADALELMGFLTSLLATEHLERFVPLALPQKDATIREAALKPPAGATVTVRTRTPAPVKPAPARAPPRSSGGRPVAARPVAPAPRRAAATGATNAAAKSTPRPAAPASRQPASPPPRPTRAPVRLTEQVTRLIIADAVRFLDWGNEWPQLAGLIARLADRPAEKEIWGVLSAHRATIEARLRARRS